MPDETPAASTGARPGPVVRIVVSLSSVAAGIVALAGLKERIPWTALIYTVVGVVVLTGWALRVFVVREAEVRAVWRSLFEAVIAGFTLATLYVWIAPRIGR
ncbi:MAG: hypothetical protein M3373_11385 [Gemmatimonadota bacterium]|nr:hypothetical protein [Gemmatimonadota bacterium]